MTLHERLAELAAIGASAEGIDRALFTPAERTARERFAAWSEEAGLRVEQDRAGNVFARLAGREDLAPIQCGSHLDTVRNGGAYDGSYGVIGGLEALARIAASGTRPRRPLEVVAWAGEEGSRFPLGCLGSAVYAGLTPYDDVRVLVADDGEPFPAALSGPAGLLPNVAVRDGFPHPAAYLELHIEQGPVMEREGVRLGIVSAIAGQRRFRVVVDGVAGHAGTIPMNGRADALCAMSELVLAVETAAREVGEAVGTVGHLIVEPNQTNIVPGRASARIDVRSVDDDRVAAIEERIRASAAAVASARRVKIALEAIEIRAAVPMDEHLRGLVRGACISLDPRAREIPSGAGHDAMCIAHVAPAAMIFVPSIGGRSHVGDERTAPADLELGVEALAAALLAVDRDSAYSSTEKGIPMQFFICGSALRGQPDHGNLGEAKFVREAKTKPIYRLHSVEDQHPGIYEVASGGIAIAGEIYEMTDAQHEHLLATEPPNLYEAPIQLEDGSTVNAMIYPRDLIEQRGYRDISEYGGWAAYKAATT